MDVIPVWKKTMASQVMLVDGQKVFRNLPFLPLLMYDLAQNK